MPYAILIMTAKQPKLTELFKIYKKEYLKNRT